jgi:DNA (cytosine-5)-methyltransferase 1
MRPRLLDLFCGAGGCGKGFDAAGFEVVGVDIDPHPAYPYEFHQADALEVLRILVSGGEWEGYRLEDFAAIHASPPCQAYSVLRHAAEKKGKDKPALIEPTRELLEQTGLPYTIENVPGAPLRNAITLCGSMFELGCVCGNGETVERAYRQLRRHRLFECSFLVWQPVCQHQGEAIGVYGGGPVGRYTFGNGAKRDYYNRRGGYQGTIAEKSEAMGIDWMTAADLNQAIPPAYASYLGSHMLALLDFEAAA